MRKILQRLLSKLFIVSTIIIIQMIWWFFLFYTASVASRVFQDLMYVAAILLSLYIVNRRMKMYIKMSWIFLILSVPIVGIPCYFFFGRPELTSKTQKRMARIVEAYAPLRPENELLNETLRQTDMDAYRQSRLITQNQKYPLYAEDCTEYFKSGEEAFESILKDLRSAEKFIFMEYFIIDDGEMWREIVKILLEKAKAGVEVRLLYDGMGSQFTLPFRYKKKLTDQGVKCLVFNPFRPMLSTIQNNRDHRKILVIDGNVAFNGGVNIADEYINRKERFGHWKDTAVMLKGDGVWNFTMMFLQMWEVISGDKTEYNMYRPTVKNVVNNGYVIPYGDSPLDDENVGELVYMDMINNAKDYIYISTPYLIPDNEMLTVLGYAAKSGVDVRIITPEIPDKWYVSVITRSFYRDLETLGVKVYEYKGGFNHAKMFLSDDKSAVVGTINLDYRSLYLHFECATYMYKTSCIKDIKADFDDMFENRCHRITHDDINNRSFWSRFMSVILRTIAPLL